MLTDRDAIDYLLSQADEEEACRSIYWEYHVREFSIDLEGHIQGNSTLGHAPRARSLPRQFAHRLMQTPVRRLGAAFRYNAYSEKTGRAIAKRQDRLFNGDFLRHTLTLALIREQIDLTGPGNSNLVIGDGFGTMASLFLETSPERKVIVANLTKPLCLDLIYLLKAFPGRGIAVVRNADELSAALADDAVRIIAVQADNAALLEQAPIGVAVNIVSMQEMDLPIVASYFDALRKNPASETIFYCCNHRYKISNFEEYPWQSGDEILVDGICEWSQLYYDLNPPFFHHRDRDKKVVLHRLARLEKYDTA